MASLAVNEDPTLRIALVTGATGAIGGAIARQLAMLGNFEVVLLSRNPQKAGQLVTNIKAATGNDNVSWAAVDLSRRASIEAFAAEWKKPVHVLINNAAIAPHSREETPEGIELQFATNVLGYYWLTQALELQLVSSAPARVVNVASYWAGDLDLHDLEFRRRRYDQHQAYRQSKQANRMLTVAFAERLKPLGVTVNACHSGDVPSTLSHSLGFGGHETPEQGARTPVLLATGPECQTSSGQYFEHGRQVRCRFAENRDEISALEAACRGYDH